MRNPVRLLSLILLHIVLLAALALGATDKLQPIRDESALRVLRQIQGRVEAIRGLRYGSPIPAYYLTSKNLRDIVVRESEKRFPEHRRRAQEALLKSLRIVPADFDILKMMLPLLDEQVGGMYDDNAKRLYVREGFDVVHSSIAKLILAHEMCHALQDHTFDLKRLHIDSTDNDDIALAGLTMAEGDAMLLMSQYAEKWETEDLIKDLPAAFAMDQSALSNTPAFFQQQLLFPYLQGQVVVTEGIRHGAAWRNRLFTDPPQTCSQVIHTEKYFAQRDTPSSLTLLLPAGSHIVVPDSPTIPEPPKTFRLEESNRFGELGTRLLFEQQLGTGVAYAAAEGWHGDAYRIYGDGKGKWWICWETAWESPRDAGEFTGAWVTLWRTISPDKGVGDPDAADQTFRSGEWNVAVSRRDRRAVVNWGN